MGHVGLCGRLIMDDRFYCGPASVVLLLCSTCVCDCITAPLKCCAWHISPLQLSASLRHTHKHTSVHVLAKYRRSLTLTDTHARTQKSKPSVQKLVEVH